MFTPGASGGTIIIDCWRYVAADGSVLPIRIKRPQCGCPAPDDHHLRPLMTYSEPSRRISVWMLRASEEATPGSVIRNAERVSPFANGNIQRRFWSGVP